MYENRVLTDIREYKIKWLGRGFTDVRWEGREGGSVYIIYRAQW